MTEKTTTAPRKVRKEFPGKSRTKVSEKNQANVNVIMQKYAKTGVITHLNTQQPRYGFAPAMDFKTAADLVIATQNKFMELPSEVRKKFGNSAETFLEALEDPNSVQILSDAGLLDQPAEELSEPPAGDPPAAEPPAEPEPAP